MVCKLYNVGYEFDSTNGGRCVIIERVSSKNITIKFIESGYITTTTSARISTGHVKDLTLPTVCGVGYSNDGLYSRFDIIDGKKIQNKCYVSWSSMIRRCYDENQRHKNIAYVNCSVCDEWLYFQNYADFYHNYPYKEGDWQLDKDILVKGNNIYSDNFCCFVPQEINKLLSLNSNIRGKYAIGVSYRLDINKYSAHMNVNGKLKSLGEFDSEMEAFLSYKDHKEKYIKKLADKWRHKLDIRVYDSLMNWNISFDD